LGAFKATHSLVDFLQVLDVLATLKVDVPQVWQTWKRLNKKVDGKGAVRSVLVWRSSLDLSACSSDADTKDAETGSSSTGIQSPQIDIDVDVVKHAFDSFMHDEEITEYIQARIKDASYGYGLFVAALPFEQDLPKYPVIDEAARLIGQHLKAFFTDVEEITGDSAASATPVRHPGIHRFIDDDLIPWAFDAERRHWQGDPGPEADCRLAQLERLEEIRPFLIADLYLSEPDTFPPGFSLATLARAIPYLPQRDIEGLLVGEEFNDEFLETEGCAELIDVLLALPLLKPFNSWDQYEKSVPQNSVLREYAQDVCGIQELPALSIDFYEKLIFDLGVVSFTNISSALQLSNEEEALTFKRLRALIASGIRRLTALRRHDFGGQWPFAQEVAAGMGLGMERICDELEFTPRHDVSYLIAVDKAGQGFGLCSFFSYIRNKEERFARARSENLILAFDAAIDEGWDEFATASLTFYLFTQPILFDGELHADWHRLSKILRASNKLPGAERIGEAAALAVEIMRAKGKGDGLDALCLAGWAEETTEDLAIDPAAFDAALTFKQIVNGLIEQIGKEAWLKLSLHGKKQLQNAESLWSSVHMQLGHGTGDFGVVATAYVKVFEGEMVDRMRPVTSTPAFVAYYRQTYKKEPDQHLGLGAVLHLLKKFERLPVDLQDLIRVTNIRVQENKGLVNELLKAIDFRNKGAHAGPFSEKQFLELRELIFRDQLLKRFVDLL
jgi:hypothetical protein